MSRLKHEVTEIAPKTWCLSEFRLVNAFLLEGKNKAALIDTGCRIGNLKNIVRELTEKPLVILMTHGHFDHLGGIGQFEENVAYMHPKEKDMLEEMKSRLNCKDLNEMRVFYVKTRAPIRYPEANVEEILELISCLFLFGARLFFYCQVLMLLSPAIHRGYYMPYIR